MGKRIVDKFNQQSVEKLISQNWDFGNAPDISKSLEKYVAENMAAIFREAFVNNDAVFTLTPAGLHFSLLGGALEYLIPWKDVNHDGLGADPDEVAENEKKLRIRLDKWFKRVADNSKAMNARCGHHP